MPPATGKVRSRPTNLQPNSENSMQLTPLIAIDMSAAIGALVPGQWIGLI
jgi:hypothetical protein